MTVTTLLFSTPTVVPDSVTTEPCSVLLTRSSVEICAIAIEAVVSTTTAREFVAGLPAASLALALRVYVPSVRPATRLDGTLTVQAFPETVAV